MASSRVEGVIGFEEKGLAALQADCDAAAKELARIAARCVAAVQDGFSPMSTEEVAELRARSAAQQAEVRALQARLSGITSALAIIAPTDTAIAPTDTATGIAEVRAQLAELRGTLATLRFHKEEIRGRVRAIIAETTPVVSAGTGETVDGASLEAERAPKSGVRSPMFYVGWVLLALTILGAIIAIALAASGFFQKN